jgi:hypothetical protein
MSQRGLVVGLPLVAGSALISIAVLNVAFSEGAFMLEWMGAFLAFYGLSCLIGPRRAVALSGVILVVGIVGDIAFLGGMTPVDWTLANYMVFIHAVLGSLTGQIITKIQS